MSGKRELIGKKRSANSGTGSDLSQQGEQQKIVPPAKRPRVAETKHDSTGYNVVNPTKSIDCIALEISVAKYAQSRAKEIETLSQAIEWEGTKLSFQRLPRHMRRRAMSHDIRRIPRRLRLRAQAELEKREKKGESKRPSRRHRRRPGNLLSEYQRRQKQNVWLETHIWHAKRFKMSTIWGYRLPVHPSDKSLRACYRAATHHCLLQDVSYEGCIEVKGHPNAICSALSHICSKKAGLTFEAKASVKGGRWGKVMLYQWDSYPQSPIAPVSFLWQASGRTARAESGDDCKETVADNKLWIWVHPSAYAEVLALLGKACSVQQCLGTIGSPTELSVPSQYPLIELRSLKDQLVKFRLTGPASNLILAETLKPVNLQPTPSVMSENLEKRPEGVARVAEMTLWWQVYYSEKEHQTAFAAQKKSFEEVIKRQSSDEIPPCIVLALTVQDPRVLRPAVRQKIDVKSSEMSSLTALTWEDVPASSTISPLWDDHIREEVSRTKMSDLEMNKARSQMLVPGSVLDLGTKESCVPVLLLHRPGSQLVKMCKHTPAVMRAGVDAGWDLILPKGWSMAFWLALVYRGARVGGLREARSISTRSSTLHFPHDFVDTNPGRHQTKATCEELVEKYVRRPPAKRVNYSRIGVVAPFCAPLPQLELEWQSKLKDVLNCEPLLLTDSSIGCHQPLRSIGAESVVEASPSSNDSKPVTAETKAYILRCRKLLRCLQEMAMCSCHAKKRNTNFIKRKTCSASSGQDLSAWLWQPENLAQVSEHRHSLVPVSVSCPHRGVPLARAMICLPSEEDARKLKEDSSFGGPVERLHPKCRSKEGKKGGSKKKKMKKVTSVVDGTDQNLERTKKSQPTEIPSETKCGLNTQKPLEADGRLETEEKESSGKKSVTSTCSPDITATQKVVKKTSKAVLNPRQEQEKKELLQAPKTVLDSSDRPIIGFLTDGDFDLGQGHGSGIGLCSLVGLLTALSCPYLDRPLLVLIRNPSSRQYRFAHLSIIH